MTSMPAESISSRDKRPVFCDLIVTEACMLRCKMCNMWQSGAAREELSTDIWKNFIDSFADLAGNRPQVQFVGGEPLIKKGLPGLIRHAVRRGLSTTMTTNGYLIDEDMAGEIASSGLNSIVFSLDSLERETHDFLRGADGAYDRMMKAIELIGKIKNASPRVYITSIIMQYNMDDLLRLAEWVNKNSIVDGISFQAVMQPFFTPQDNEWQRKNEFKFLWPVDIEKTDRVLDSLVILKNNGYKINNPVSQFGVFKSYFRNPERFVRVSKCNLGYNSISVNTAGKIFLCLSMDPIGDIRDCGKLEEIWFSEKAERVRNEIRRCKNNCKLMINCFFEEEKEVVGV